ncbi:MAG TPA: hypothetical protein VGO00_27880 [Kofleriaceae bacterium]|nr:hypothetical protein [Kofleriaceae bacterium]
MKRGLDLVHAGACNDCHTPMAFDDKLGMPVPRMDRMLSGHPQGASDPKSTLADGDQAVIGPTFTSFGLPFGVVYAANLTPDKATGLGGWDAQMFVRAMRTGRHMGLQGRPVMPPMPWMSLAELADDDLLAIWSYLQTIPAIENRVPDPKVPPAVFDEITKGYAALLSKR